MKSLSGRSERATARLELGLDGVGVTGAHLGLKKVISLPTSDHSLIPRLSLNYNLIPIPHPIRNLLASSLHLRIPALFGPNLAPGIV